MLTYYELGVYEQIYVKYESVQNDFYARKTLETATYKMANVLS